MGNVLKPKLTFDVNNDEHLKKYDHFLRTGKWEGVCPFNCDPKFLSVPHMIQAQIVSRFLSEHIKMEEVAEA